MAIIGWLHAQAVLATADEASALLAAAGMSPLYENDADEGALLQQFGAPAPASSVLTAPPTRRTNLPAALTSFVGRAQQLVEVAQSITEHRLVTITGAGGIGKTRFAIELTRRVLEQDGSSNPAFAAGVWFVALEAVDSSERMVSAIADAVQCPPPGAVDVRDHLLSYLHARHLLLVLDNFEHLRDYADLLTTILAAAPYVHLLVTSREALNLEQEWRYPLTGLSQHADDDAEETTPSSAACLFVERAQRVFPAFDLAAERAAVERICRLVEGNPLAIELAATWTRMLSCQDIADEIVKDLAFLTSDMRDVSDRHRSMQAVFDHSWQLLSPEERQVFARLSVFQGGFQRAAAEQVAGATLPNLDCVGRQVPAAPGAGGPVSHARVAAPVRRRATGTGPQRGRRRIARAIARSTLTYSASGRKT